MLTLYFPSKAASEGTQPEIPPMDLARGKGEGILVVEDKPAIRKAIMAGLTELGYRPVPAANGLEALDILERSGEEIAMVLTDIVMPGMGGFGLFRSMRRRGMSVPVVIMTGHGVVAELKALWQQGFVACVQKPTDLAELAQAVEKALGGG
jgi:two-component system cell cycle sensor histidine kinase/response regulator CckA